MPDLAGAEAVSCRVDDTDPPLGEMRDIALLESEPDAPLGIGDRRRDVVGPPERRPGKFLHGFAAQSEYAALIVHDPDVTRGILDNREHVSTGHTLDGNEAIARQIPELAVGRCPDAATVVFEKRTGAHPVEQPALPPKPLQPPTAPSAESEATPHPDASVPGGQHRPDRRCAQPLFLRERRDRQIMKSVESTQGGDPDVAFTIFEDITHGVSRKAVRFGEQFGAPPVHTRQTATEHGDPSHTVPVIAELPRKIVGKTRRRGG